jgi:hypothetical protein
MEAALKAKCDEIKKQKRLVRSIIGPLAVDVKNSDS